MNTRIALVTTTFLAAACSNSTSTSTSSSTTGGAASSNGGASAGGSSGGASGGGASAGGSSGSSSGGGGSGASSGGSSGTASSGPFLLTGPIASWTQGTGYTVEPGACVDIDGGLNCSSVGTGAVSAAGDFSITMTPVPAAYLETWLAHCTTHPTANPSGSLSNNLHVRLRDPDGGAKDLQLLGGAPPASGPPPTGFLFGGVFYADRDTTVSGLSICKDFNIDFGAGVTVSAGYSYLHGTVANTDAGPTLLMQNGRAATSWYIGH